MRRPPARVQFLLPLCALIYGTVVFVPMMGNSFYRDDFGWVERAIDAVDHPGQWFVLAKTDFRPLASLSMVFNLMVSGLDPAGYYLFNLLLHLANIVLLMALVLRLSGGSSPAAGIAGLLFAGGFGNYGLAIIWICGRTGPIADLFTLGTLVAYWDWLEHGRTRDRVLAVTLFALALLGKETAAVLLPLLALLEWAHPVRESRRLARGLPGRLAPYALMLAVYLVFQFAVWRAGSPILASEYVLGWHVPANLLEYLASMFVPLNPASRVVSVPTQLAAALRALYLVLLIAVPLAGLVLLVRPIPRTMKLALLWIPLTLLPVIFFTFPTSTRYLYTPSMGLAAFLGMTGAAWWARDPGHATRGRRLAMALALVALLAGQALAMRAVIRRHGEMERAEAAESWPRLLERAKAGGIPR